MAHLASSMPNGAMNMHRIPSIMKRARRGMRSNNRSMSSMSRLPIWCSAVPTHRNSSDFAIAWNSTRKAAAQTASGVPTPAQATIKPRFAMVEYASTRLAFDCEMAMNEQNKNVRPPTRMTMTDGTGHAIMMGASLMSKKTPAFTMVEECSSADVGVGATMAPRSHVWNGICAALVRPANASAVTGSTTMPGLGDADLQELEERQRVELDGHDVQSRQEGDAAQQVHDDLAEGVLDGLLGTGEADEEEGAHRGDLPAGEQPQHVVREHDEEHGRQKDEHEGEERRPAVLRAFRLVRLEVFHVTESVHADAGADDADDERHEQRQRVEVQPFGHEDVVGENRTRTQASRPPGRLRARKPTGSCT